MYNHGSNCDANGNKCLSYRSNIITSVLHTLDINIYSCQCGVQCNFQFICSFGSLYLRQNGPKNNVWGEAGLGMGHTGYLPLYLS